MGFVRPARALTATFVSARLVVRRASVVEKRKGSRHGSAAVFLAAQKEGEVVRSSIAALRATTAFVYFW